HASSHARFLLSATSISLLLLRSPPSSPLFPYTTLFRSQIDPRTTLPKVARATLENEDVVVTEAEIPAREALRHMYATTPQRLYGYDELLSELLSSNLLGDY